MDCFTRTKSWIVGGLLALLASGAGARPPVDWRGTPGWEPEGAYCRLYDAKTVMSLQGTVEKVEKVIPMKGMGYGVHILLKTETETIPVQLGPVWYVEKQSFQLQPHDVVEVTGSRVPCDGKQVILAAIVKRGHETLTFRELKGKPVWTIWQAPPAPKR